MNELERTQLELEKLQVQRQKLVYERERRNERQARRAERRAAARPVWERFKVALPLRLALLGVAGVWLLGCLWSLREQNAFAAASGFLTPWVLGLVLDGLAISCAGVAYAASLDGRPAVMARLILAVGVAASATSNGVWAAERSGGQVATIALAAGVPVAANVAFEVLLGERRRVVKRRRGLAAPTPVEPPRLVRLLLSPFAEPKAWRARVLAATAPTRPQSRATEAERLLLLAALVGRQGCAGRTATRRRAGTTTAGERSQTTHAPASTTQGRRGAKTTELQRLLKTELAPDDSRSVSALAREYAPRVQMNHSAARKVIAAFRDRDDQTTTTEDTDGRVLRLAGRGGQ